MNRVNTAGKVFGEWAGDHRAERMWKEHLPRIEQVWPLIPDSSGNYLEVGCGCGKGLRRMAEQQFAEGQCTGIDISPEMVKLAGKNNAGIKNVSIEPADFMNWRPADGLLFDVIFSMEVFYYFADIQKGLEKALSLLAPGGQLWVLVDCYLENKESHKWSDAIGVPMQIWSMEEYATGFEKAGFSNVKQLRLKNPDEETSSWPTLCTYGVK